MNKTVVVLLGLAMVVSPAIPGLAQRGQGADGGGQAGAASCEAQSFDGEHWTLDVDPELPGVVDVELNRSEAMFAAEIQLPGEELGCRVDDDVRLFTEDARLRIHDRAELGLGIDTEENASAQIELADGVSVEDAADEDEDDDRFRLAIDEGPTLVVTGENVTHEGDTLEVAGEAEIFRDGSSEDEEDDEEEAERGDGPPGARGRGGGQAGDEQAAEDGEAGDRGRQRATVTDGSYAFGDAQLRLANDTLHDVQWRNATLFRTVEVPGLSPAEERRQGPQLRLDGDDARVRIAAAGGLIGRMEADAGVEVTIADDVEIRQDGEHVFLSSDELLVVVEGEDLDVEDRTVAAEELRLHARSAQQHDGPVWKGQDTREVAELPYAFEGRHVAFELDEDGMRNLSIHGTPVGEAGFAPATVTEIDRRGANLDIEGEDFELRVQDTPAVQLRLEATSLSSDLSEETTLPSGAQVHTDVEDDELRLRVDRPADALSNETSVDHRPADEPVERTDGPAPGLQTSSERGQLGVESSSPNTITTSFDGDDELDGDVSVELGLARAMLIDDTNGNNRVDVGEPALAERPLTNGTVAVEGDELVHRFPLWSGNLTVTVEPGEETAKVTYIAHNLSAPPGSLFVLETNVQAPSDAGLTPTDTGVVVENGTTSAEYSATGPVTVDGEEAWAQRSIFVDGDDRVRVLVAYPAGDNITHDPTVSVQSSAAEVAQRLAASPYAVFVGAGLAGLMIAGTVLHRRQQRPPR